MSNVVLHRLNLPRVIADHVVGKNHSDKHRMMVGLLVMALGVGVSKLAVMVDLHAIHFLGEMIGAAIHGVGLIPYLDYLLKAEGVE